MICGECRACAMGRSNCCEQIRLLGVHVDGGMQEFLSVPLVLLHKSNRLSLDQLALVETLAIGAHAVMRSRLKQSEEALIVGAGPVGIAVAQFASAMGAKVHVVEKNTWRKAFVERMGYTASLTQRTGMPTPCSMQPEAPSRWAAAWLRWRRRAPGMSWPHPRSHLHRRFPLSPKGGNAARESQ